MMNKYIVKRILVGVLAMIVTSMVSLLVLSTLTYFYKWQAPQAQVGITLTYIITGLMGGVASSFLGRPGRNRKAENELHDIQQESLKQKIISGVTLGTICMVILLLISIVAEANSNWDMGQVILIWFLLSCSSILGVFLCGTFAKKP